MASSRSMSLDEHALRRDFLKAASKKYKAGAEKYMKFQFVMLGVPAKERQEITRSHIKNLVDLSPAQVKTLLKSMKGSEREFHFVKIAVLAQNLQVFSRRKNISIVRDLIIEGSWWDSIDTISGKVISPLLSELSALDRTTLLLKFAGDKDMWVRRAAIVSMVKTEDVVNDRTKQAVLKRNLGTDEFFINKAIGWFLREEYFYNQRFVLDFSKKHKLDRVAQREVDRAIAGRSQSGKRMKRAIKPL